MTTASTTCQLSDGSTGYAPLPHEAIFRGDDIARNNHVKAEASRIDGF
jgi:hypothetical protein